MSNAASATQAVDIYRSLFVDDALARPEFYSDANLRRLFGEKAKITKTAEWPFGSVAVHVEVPLFPQAASAAGLGGSATLWATLLRDQSVLSAKLDLRVSGAVPKAHYEYVADKFEFKRISSNRQPPTLPSPHRLFAAPSDPHGNEDAEFVFVNGSATRGLWFEFREDGTLSWMSISTERKLP